MRAWGLVGWLAVSAFPVWGQTVNHNATAALGQPDRLSNILNRPASGSLFFPYDVVQDPSVSQTRFYVADAFNSRVLGFECGGTNCTPATATAAVRRFGQPDFTSFHSNGGLGGAVGSGTLSFPRGVAVDASGNLFVADTGNNRVLVYLSAWSDATADIVLGQSTMSGASTGAALNRLNAPEGVFVDSGGNLWVADTGNHRVLEFTSPLSTGASASFAIGGGGAPSPTKLSGPRDVHVDASGDLWVADTGFSRVLRYAAPLSGGMAASVVVGHTAFDNGNANDGGLDAGSLAFPEKIFVDGGGRLWVADTGNNRVLEYDSPLGDQTADRVFGQADRSQVATFATNFHDAPDGFPNAAGMWGPRGLLRDGNGALWVCDRDNSRILSFDSPAAATPDVVADRALGKQVMVDASANLPNSRSMNNPVGVAIDTSQSPNRLWVVDIGNNRVLGYDSVDDIENDRPADILLGQAAFGDGATNRNLNGPLQNAVTAVASGGSLFFPFGIAVDGLGGVYVGDSSNSRVLHFEDPFGTNTVADRVFGQASFSARNPQFPWGTSSSLAGPGGLSVDGGDNLWVADTLDHRVVRFSDAPNQPTTSGAADLVLGQSGFVSSSSFPPYSPGCAANRMNTPKGVFAAPSGRVYVADSGNHRVLVFGSPFSNGMLAGAVFGQANFTSCTANRGGGPSASTLNDPEGVFEDPAGNVYIADVLNNRVLVYYVPFGGGDFVADEVLGQPSFASTAVTSPGPTTLAQPAHLAMDDADNLFIADREASRVTRYSGDPSPQVLLDPIAAPLVVGEFTSLSGSGFTAGSVIKLYVADSSGPLDFGPFTPANWAPGYLIWQIDPSVSLGNGFATVQIVNTDQSFILSNTQSQLLYGDPTRNIPTILTVNGVGLSPVDPSIPVANVETVLTPGASVVLTGSGFNQPLVNFFSAAGNLGPLTPTGVTDSEMTVTVPPGAPTGPASCQVVNNPYTGNVLSNAVSAVIGSLLSVSGVSQVSTTVTVTGTGFSTLSVINLFNAQGGSVVNLGGLDGSGNARIPLTFINETTFSFTVPAGAQSGPAFVQVLNPPFIPFSSSGNDPDGAFTIAVP